MNKKFKLINGIANVNNSEINLKINRFTKKEFIYHGKRFLVTTLILFVYNNFYKDELNKTKYWESITFFNKYLILGITVLVFIYSVLYYKWKNKIVINDINSIETYKTINSLDITINMNNKRFKILEFNNECMEYKKFLEEIKKRNTRIKIID